MAGRKYGDGLVPYALDECDPAYPTASRSFQALLGVRDHPPGVATGWVFRPATDTVVDSIELRRTATAF